MKVTKVAVSVNMLVFVKTRLLPAVDFCMSIPSMPLLRKWQNSNFNMIIMRTSKSESLHHNGDVELTSFNAIMAASEAFCSAIFLRMSEAIPSTRSPDRTSTL
jgi:hypothetical protein